MLRRSPLSISVKMDNDSKNEADVRAVVLSLEKRLGNVDTDDKSKKEVLCHCSPCNDTKKILDKRN
jgi:hypothetical protein